MAEKQSSVGLGGLLVIIFAVAKLANHFDYSWWWVFAPLWIPIGIILGIYAITAIIAIAIAIIAAILE